MKTIEQGILVEMNYSLTNTKGEVIDSSKGKDPLTFVQGSGNIIPGLEKNMLGKKVGDKFQVTVQPEEAYGSRNDAMVQAVPRAQFGEEAAKIQVGMQFQISDQKGQTLVVTAVEVRDNEIVLDGNHPLAGETLHFDIEVTGARELTEEERNKAGGAEESDCCAKGTCS